MNDTKHKDKGADTDKGKETEASTDIKVVEYRDTGTGTGRSYHLLPAARGAATGSVRLLPNIAAAEGPTAFSWHLRSDPEPAASPRPKYWTELPLAPAARKEGQGG